MLARVHYSAMGDRAPRRAYPDLGLLEGAISERVLSGMQAASVQLASLGVRHWLVGGLAVGAHGYPRGTSDVDFFVGDEAFERHGGGLVTMKPGVPIQAGGVVIDHLSSQEGEEFLAAALPPAGAALTVAPIEVLFYLKLKSPRAKDRADLVELVKAGADVTMIRDWLARHAPSFVAPLEDVERTARAEEG